MREIQEARCGICGQAGPFPPFFPGASLRESRCPGCDSSRRNRDVARVLVSEYSRLVHGAIAESAELPPLCDCLESFVSLKIYELQAKGALHAMLCGLPGYVCSEYLTYTPRGERNAQGILSQDATRLTFADASFDVVISQDIMEHIENPWLAFAEIARVLRPCGKHIFTVPMHEKSLTRQRARIYQGEVEHLLLPVYHKDPLDPGGALVFWDYGDDLTDILERKGIVARKALHEAFYGSWELCRVDSEVDWRRCEEACEQGDHVRFFTYNSVVFVSEGKKEPAAG